MQYVRKWRAPWKGGFFQWVQGPPSGSRQLIEQCLGFLQVLRRKALGEPAVNGREELVGFTRTCLVAHQPRTTGPRCAAPRISPAAFAPSGALRYRRDRQLAGCRSRNEARAWCEALRQNKGAPP